MSYQFGIAVSLDPLLSIYSLLCVIAFLIFFDYFACMIEYFLEKASIYKQMMQSIYREIMLMGLVSFAIMVYKASVSNNDPGDDSITGQVFSSLDFAQMLLFWVTLCQVFHSFYFMGLTIWNEHRYHLYNTEDTLELTSAIEMNLKYKNWKTLFESPFWPFSALRHRVEFYLLKDIFQEIYLLSSNFDYGSYLSFSFGKYCMNLVNRSLIAWFFIILILVINYIRIAAGFDCGRDNDEEEMKDPFFKNSINCSNYSVRLFIFSGIIMSIYFTALLLISHLYKQRLIHLGCEHEPSDYVDYMKLRRKLILKKQQEKTEDQYHNEKYQNRELRLEIEQEIHSSEHNGEEDAEIIGIANVLLFFHGLVKHAWIYVKDTILSLFVVCSRSPTVKRYPSSKFTRSGSVTTAANSSAGGITELVQPTVGVSRDPSLPFDANDPNQLFHMKTVSLKHKLSVQYITEVRKKSINTDFGLPAVSESPTKFSVASSALSPDKESMNSPPPPIESPGSQLRMAEAVTGSSAKSPPSRQLSATNPMKANQIAPSDGSSRKIGKASRAQSFLMYNVVKTTPKHYRKSTTTGVINKYKQPKEIKKLKRIASAIDKDLNSIFFFKRPLLFLRAAEISVIFNSVYMAVWATGMLTIINYADYTRGWFVACHIFMILPFIWGLYAIRIICETSSLIIAVSELDLGVIHDVLQQMEATDMLVTQVRQTFLDIIDARVNQQLSPEEFVENLFIQIDTDGNGYLDRDELRNMLRKVRVTFSNYRYKLLFRTLDLRSRGSVSKEEFKRFIFEDPVHPQPHQATSLSSANPSPTKAAAAVVSLSPFKALSSSNMNGGAVAVGRSASFNDEAANKIIQFEERSNDDEKNSYSDEVNDGRFPAMTRQLIRPASTSSNNSSIPPGGKVAGKSSLFQQEVSDLVDDRETEGGGVERLENMLVESLE